MEPLVEHQLAGREELGIGIEPELGFELLAPKWDELFAEHLVGLEEQIGDQVDVISP